MTTHSSSASVSAYSYRLPLVQPMRFSWGEVDHREGVLVRYTVDGRCGWGDAAPLPDYSPDTLEETTHAIVLAVERWTAMLRLHLFAPPPLLAGMPPSARMALSDAYRCVVFGSVGCEVPMKSNVEIAALLTSADASDLEREVERAIRHRNCRAVKLKVGGRAVTDDVHRVRIVASVLGEQTTLRLDANRAWSRAQAADFWSAVQRLGISIAFIEEPTYDDAAWPHLFDLGMPLAFDETLRHWTPYTFPHWHLATAAVLKPTILGGYDATVEWIAESRRRCVAPVLSGCFESGVGHRMVALAAALTDAPAGLGTYRSVADDLLTTRLLLDGDAAHPQLFLSGEVDESRLTRIA